MLRRVRERLAARRKHCNDSYQDFGIRIRPRTGEALASLGRVLRLRNATLHDLRRFAHLAHVCPYDAGIGVTKCA